MFLSRCKGNIFFKKPKRIVQNLMAVNVFRNTVNLLRGSRQLFPGARVNLFSMDRQQGITVLQYYSITEAITAKK